MILTFSKSVDTMLEAPFTKRRDFKIESPMNESEFSSLIDCNFPYDNREEISRLIDLACQLSPNAAFMVAHELARPPLGVRGRIPDETLLLMLDELDSQFDHPIKPVIFSICRKMVRSQEVSESETLSALDQLEEFQDFYSAAAIVYFSCRNKPYWKRIEAKYRRLIQSWESKRSTAPPSYP